MPLLHTLRQFSQAEIAEAVRLMASEDPRRRVLMTVTIAHRALAMRQSVVILVLSCLTMGSLYEAASTGKAFSPDAVRNWATWTIVNIAVRAALTLKVFLVRSPAAVVRSTAIRLIPLAIAVLAAAQWIWTIGVFVGNVPATTFITFAGLLATSVAAMSLWSTSPVAPAVYVAVTWGVFVYQLTMSSLLPAPALGAVILVVALLLWACAYLQVQQVQAILDRSDEVNLLLHGLRTANADLQDANAALSTMRRNATSELEARSLFFNSASHDFRQRLHAMKLLANGALRAGKNASEAGTSLRRLVQSVEDVERYITDVLDFARVDKSMTVPERRSVRVQTIFQSLELAFGDIAVASGVTLVLRATSAEITSDASMLQRILENLVSNALKSSSPRVLVTARRVGGGLKLQVWDRGTGMDQKQLDLIFVPFHRSSTSGPGYAGSGLGMAIVKRFADCLGYAIDIKTRLGRGSVVTVLVPAQDVCGTAPMAPSTRSSPSGTLAESP